MGMDFCEELWEETTLITSTQTTLFGGRGGGRQVGEEFGNTHKGGNVGRCTCGRNTRRLIVNFYFWRVRCFTRGTTATSNLANSRGRPSSVKAQTRFQIPSSNLNTRHQPHSSSSAAIPRSLVKINTQFLFGGVIVSVKFVFDGIQKIAPERSFKASNNNTVLDVLGGSGTERRFGEDDEVVPIKEGQVNG